jgi:hypothetical protein
MCVGVIRESRRRGRRSPRKISAPFGDATARTFRRWRHQNVFGVIRESLQTHFGDASAIFLTVHAELFARPAKKMHSLRGVAAPRPNYFRTPILGLVSPIAPPTTQAAPIFVPA